MYIYQLPFDINKELCRLLDNDDVWKDLAGRMNYSAFDVNEIEQTAKRQTTSPTNILLVRWGQYNHRAEELLILLYRMKHYPAMRCLIPVVDKKFQKLAKKHDDCNAPGDTAPVDDNYKRHKAATRSESIPLPIMLIENKGQIKDAQMTPLPASNTNGHRYTSRTSTDNTSSDMSRDAGHVDDELMKTTIPILQYRDLEEATGNWAQSNLLGRGGFGQVYKGEWKLLPVAVKVLNSKDYHKELIRELTSDHFRHDNILPLYGYSIGGPKVCLVYQLMTGGSLDQRLKCTTLNPPLTWCQRYRIAQGVARGLSYLHTMSQPLIHGDIKPANILLDQCTMPKIGDFGLARRGTFEDRPLLVSRIHGTRPYIPKEYLLSRRISPAVDVFSYGVVLLEMATLQKPLDQDRRKELELLSDYIHAKARQGIDLATLEDPKLRNTPESFPQLCRDFITLGLNCAWLESSKSPTMLDVYRRLQALSVPPKWND